MGKQRVNINKYMLEKQAVDLGWSNCTVIYNLNGSLKEIQPCGEEEPILSVQGSIPAPESSIWMKIFYPPCFGALRNSGLYQYCLCFDCPCNKECYETYCRLIDRLDWIEDSKEAW